MPEATLVQAALSIVVAIITGLVTGVSALWKTRENLKSSIDALALATERERGSLREDFRTSDHNLRIEFEGKLTRAYTEFLTSDAASDALIIATVNERIRGIELQMSRNSDAAGEIFKEFFRRFDKQDSEIKDVTDNLHRLVEKLIGRPPGTI